MSNNVGEQEFKDVVGEYPAKVGIVLLRDAAENKLSLTYVSVDTEHEPKEVTLSEVKVFYPAPFVGTVLTVREYTSYEDFLQDFNGYAQLWLGSLN